VTLEGVFIQIGLVPNTDWLKGVVELTKHGEIIVDAKAPGAGARKRAAGDATTAVQEIIIAVRRRCQGSAAHSDRMRTSCFA
jgi:alkyl hydroperoxide reductase subunit F